jgi:hypothetical protein
MNENTENMNWNRFETSDIHFFYFSGILIFFDVILVINEKLLLK